MNEIDFFGEALAASRTFGLALAIVYSRPYAIKLRLRKPEGTFIEAYHSQKTGRVSFALIKGGRRIYGADNKDGWHEHPYGEQERHFACRPFSISEFCEKALSHLPSKPVK